MSGVNNIENLDKRLSNILTLSENHNVGKLSTKWLISKCNIEKHIVTVGGYLQSDWIYKEDKKYYYLIFYPNGQNDSSKGLASIQVVFYEEIPENAHVEGEIEMQMCIQGEERNMSMKFDVKCFTKQQDIELIDTENLRIHTTENDLIICCLITNITHYVECNFDGKKISRKQNITPFDIFICLSKLSDVTFDLINNEKCDAVKALLVKVPFFRKLFEDHDNIDTYNLTNTNISKYVFDQFLCYLYTNAIPPFNFKLAYELYALAHYFEFTQLKNLCFTYLSGSLTEKNTLIVLKLAHKSNDLDLKKECFKFIKDADLDTLSRESVF